MQDKQQSVFDVFWDVWSKFTFAQFTWIIFAAFFTWIAYNLAVYEEKSTSKNSDNIIWWIAGLGGWGIAVAGFGYKEMVTKGSFGSSMVFVFSILITCLATFLAKNKNDFWMKIISQSLFILILFCYIITIIFAKSIYDSYSWCVLFGFSFGLIIFKLFTNISATNQILDMKKNNRGTGERPDSTFD